MPFTPESLSVPIECGNYPPKLPIQQLLSDCLTAQKADPVVAITWERWMLSPPAQGWYREESIQSILGELLPGNRDAASSASVRNMVGALLETAA